jgi:hypothetical protein
MQCHSHVFARVLKATKGWTTHIDDGARTEACSPIKPVIALQFVHFDAFAIVDRRRSQSHGEGIPSCQSGLGERRRTAQEWRLSWSRTRLSM